jgi:hypothetical protein
MVTYDNRMVSFRKFRGELKFLHFWSPPPKHFVQFDTYFSLKGFTPSTAKLYVTVTFHKFICAVIIRISIGALSQLNTISSPR